MWNRGWIAAPWAGALLVVLAAAVYAWAVDYAGTTRPLEPTPLATLLPELDWSAPVEAAPAKPPASEASPLGPVSREMRAKIGWAVSGVSMLLALLLALTVPWWIAFEALAPLGDRRRWLMIGAGVAAGAAALGSWFGDAAVLPHFVQVLVDNLPAPVETVRRVNKSLAAAAIVTMIFAFGAPLAFAQGERTIEWLAEQTKRLRRLLFIGAALLVTGLLEIAALLRWPAVRLPAADAQAVQQAADALSVAAGSLLTLVLLATYGVAALVLHVRLQAVARAKSDAGDPAKQLEELGVGADLFQQIARAMAVLAPLLAGGPVSSVLDMLTY